MNLVRGGYNMSEQIKHGPETAPASPETILEHREIKGGHEKAQSEIRHEHAEHIDRIRSNIEHEAAKAEAAKEQLISVNEKQPEHHHYATKKIKSDQYKKTLSQVRQNLPKNQQKFSSFVHQPTVERVSEIGAKTVARPSGILGGALLALIGSSIVIYIGKRIGFEVPNTIFAFLFIIGFVLGISIEVIISFINRLRPKHRRQKELYR